MATSVFVDVSEKSFNKEEATGTAFTSFGAVGVGSGSKVFRVDESGMWLGAAKWADAPFKVDMDGNLTATSLTITGYIPTGGAAADVNGGVTSINAAKINISGATTFTSGYDPTSKVAMVGGNYTSTSATAAKVQIFPDANTGIVAYASNGTSVVFKVVVGGTDVGDVIMGNYSGGSGAKWDQSAGILKIKGDIEAGNIDADRISSGTFSTSRIPNLSATKITSGYLSADRIEAGSLNASVIGAGTINAATINVTNLNASNITQGVHYIGSTGQASSIVIRQNGQNGYLTWTNGNKIWSDESNYMGFTAIGERFYFYTGSVLYSLFQRGAAAKFYAGIYSVGNFNIQDDSTSDYDNMSTYNARIRKGSLWINTSDSPSERLWVDGSAKITDNLKSDHHDPNGNKSYNLGGDSNAWDYVYADDFINKSMGWYDDGAELQDGTIVSDMEALRRIRPHSVMKNKNGSMKLDPDTLPKAVFRRAKDRNTGIPYKRNKNGIAISPETGEPVGDGESLTHMVSLIFGALKEVDNRLIKVESKVK